MIEEILLETEDKMVKSIDSLKDRLLCLMALK